MTKYLASDSQLQQLGRLDIDGLVAFIDACKAASDAVLGVINQPRSEGGADDIIDALLGNRLNSLQLAGIEILRKKRPANKYDLSRRNHCLANWEMCCDNDLEALKILAAINCPSEFGPARVQS